MKTWFFYIGAGIDIIAFLVAVVMMIGDSLKGRSGTNNPTMLALCLLLGALIVGAFLLKNAGKIGFANALLWVPGFPLACYGLFMLMFIVFKPDMK